MSLKLSAGCQCCDTPPPVDEICICGDTVQMILIFQDEAIAPYYNPNPVTGSWDDDVDLWTAATAAFGAPEYAQLCQLWRYGATIAPALATSQCKPKPSWLRDLPAGWTWDELVRSPTEAEVKAVYDSAKGGAGVDDPTGLVLLGVDISGSMNLDTMGDGYTDFKDYLTSISVEWKQVLFNNERWVKLSAANYEATVGGVTPTEFDVSFTGLENGSDCDICEDLVGDFTLTDPVQITSGFDDDGWSGDDWSRAADVPSGTTHACVWKYENIDYCEWTYSFGSSPPMDDIVKRFDIRGVLLARFRLSDTDYKWRVIILYKLFLSCEVMGMTDEASVDSGWYWEHGENNPTCILTGAESWTANFPTASPLLSVYCSDTHEANFSDWCDFTLVLNNAETG